jgi:hypothetical protein
MRYWAYFVAKLIVAGGILYASLGLLNPLAPHDSELSASTAPRVPRIVAPGQGKVATANQPGPGIQVEIALPGKDTKDGDVAKPAADDLTRLAPFSHAGEYLAINVALMVWFLFGAGMLYLIVYDQRYRCRVCLRRLRMPVETGSRGFMLQLGRPRTEYICPYGHGTLKQEEFQTSGLENPEWTASSGDMWDELYAASKQDREEE